LSKRIVAGDAPKRAKGSLSRQSALRQEMDVIPMLDQPWVCNADIGRGAKTLRCASGVGRGRRV
jgi:hypothetical protein